MSSAKSRKRGVPARLQPRYAVYRDLNVTYEGYTADIPLRVPDVSPQGIFINTPRLFPEGAVLIIEFRLTLSDTLIKARGEVRYCLPGVGVGVEFVEISPESQRAIEEEMSTIGVLPRAAP